MPLGVLILIIVVGAICLLISGAYFYKAECVNSAEAVRCFFFGFGFLLLGLILLGHSYYFLPKWRIGEVAPLSKLEIGRVYTVVVGGKPAMIVKRADLSDEKLYAVFAPDDGPMDGNFTVVEEVNGDKKVIKVAPAVK